MNSPCVRCGAPSLVFRLNLHKMPGNRLGHLCLEVNACAQDFVACLILWRDLFQGHRRIVEHSQFEIPARSKDMPLPIGFQKIGDS